MRAPTVIPKTIAQVKDEPSRLPIRVAWWVAFPAAFREDRLVACWAASSAACFRAAAPPPPPPTSRKLPSASGWAARWNRRELIFQPKPEYPPLAKMARIQGMVRLDAIISKDGTIQDLKVISGHPLLVKAALEAVQRWRYQPTLLNGDAVEVATEIDVNFTLAE